MLQAAAVHDALVASQWRVAAMNGLAKLRQNDPPAGGGLLVAVALVLPVDGLSEEPIDQLLDAADEVATRLGVELPGRYIPMALGVELHRLELIADPNEHASRYFRAN